MNTKGVARRQQGAALILVLLGIMVFVAAGAFIILAVDRNTDLRFAFQRNIVGFHSAEAGIHVGAVSVLNAMQNFGLPTNCNPQTFVINGRTVTYTLGVPANAPWNGVAGSCTEAPLTVTEAQGTTFGGLNAQLYTYSLTAASRNALGFNEASINNQFQAHQIPMFQFAAFYSGDMELLPGPTTIINGRLHTNGDMYLNNDTCGSAPSNGLNILGQITVVGSGVSGTSPLNRGRKDDTTVNHDNVYISLDGTSTNMQVLGTGASGSTSCAQVATRQIAGTEINTFNGIGPRIVTGMKNITLPTPIGLTCVPWISGCGAIGGSYWQNANLRVALDTTTTTTIGSGAQLYNIEVLNADGSVNGGLTASLSTFMQANPGAITYSDVPKTTSPWNCTSASPPTCESTAYAAPGQYTQPWPTASGSGNCVTAHGPRGIITSTNYCNDYRYGGFFNWRERKPMLMLNIDWMALEEYNNANGNVFFDPTTTTNGGLVVFLTVKDTATAEGYKADNYGVRLYDAGRARRNSTDPGVTFVTDRAAYVAGNFNCPQPNYAGSDLSPAPCGDATWPPTSSSTDQKPTSIIADTVNVLSCNWIAQQGGGTIAPCGTYNMDADQWAQGCGVGCRPVDEASTKGSGTTPTGASCGGSGCQAQPTIINAAFFAGTDQTWCSSNTNGTNCGNAYYSGGVENYPRFHENWSGVKYWYQGSLVSSGPPTHTCFEYTAQLVAIANDPSYTCTASTRQGFWSTQRYSPPTRRWFYDVSFNNASYLPPMSPRFVYLSLVYFTQVFQ